MQVLITGGFGFIGAKLANTLSDAGHDVIVTARYGSTSSRKLRENIHVIYCDSYSDDNAMSPLYNGIDVCFHLANKNTPAESNKDIVSDINNNLISTIKLLNALKANNVKIVYMSSGGTVYGNTDKALMNEDDTGHPMCSYGIVKKTVEDYLHLYARLYNLKFSVIRLANVYGVGQRLGATHGAISAFIYKALTNESIEIWGDGTVIRDYVYIDDVVTAIIAAAESNIPNATYNIGNGAGYSLNQIIEILRYTLSDKEINVNYMPGRTLDVPVNVLDISRAKNELMWFPKVDLMSGISLTADWARMIV